MKQRISVEDIKQLTPDQQAKLRAWWQPQDGDYFSTKYEEQFVGEALPINYGEYEKAKPSDSECPLLSIGQCLELLGNKLFSITPPWDSHNRLGTWSIWVDGQGYGEKGDELINVLWQAVKSIL